MKNPKTNDLRDWADNPAASKMVPISPGTLHSIADELDELRALEGSLMLLGWGVSGVDWVYRGEYAETNAKAAEKRCGGTAKAFPVYKKAQG